LKLLHSLPPFNFCGIDGVDFESAKAVVLPVPYDSTTSYNPGARNGPHAMIQASRNMELYDEELGYSPADIGIFTLDELEPSMKSPEDEVARVEEAVGEILEAKKFPVVFGGEHSISLGAIRAMNETYENVSVLHIDAHADLRNEYEGTKYSHACVMRRACELCDVAQLGIRSISAEEAEFLKESEKPFTFFMHQIRERGLAACIDDALGKLGKDIYVSIDVDGFDPGVLPGTGTPEPGGFSWNEMCQIVKAACEKKHVVGFDIMELSPIPGNPVSEFTAAKLAYKFLGYEFKPRG